MAESPRLEDLTEEQQAKFLGVMAELEKLAIPELIAESTRLRLPNPMPEAMKPRYRSNFAGAIAAQRAISYLVELREANDKRLELGRQIFELTERSKAITATDPEQAEVFIVIAGHKAGEQEVAIHRFVSAIRRLEMFLPAAARSCGFRIPPADMEILRNYEPLRHYYEHLEDRLPGRNEAHEGVVETDDERGWQITMVVPVDE
jgi:hypothetical protein